MLVDRLRYELQVMGRKVTWAPILVMVGFALLADLLLVIHFPPARTLAGGMEMVLPLMAGAIAAAVTHHDQAIELQLTMPKKYHVTVLHRVLVILVWTTIVTLLSSMITVLLKLEFLPYPAQMTSPPLQFLVGQLSWVATLLWCVGLCLCLTTLLHSNTASTTLLGCLWILEIIYRGTFVSTEWLRPFFLFPTTLLPLAGPAPQAFFNFWLINRLEVLGTALVLLFVGWLLLHNTEGLLKGSGEEE